MTVEQRRPIDRKIILALSLMLLIGLAGRAWVIIHRCYAVHDEAITLLQVSGRAADYADLPYFNKWVRASDWRAVFHGPPGGYAEIVRGLASADRHPPLYFLCLAAWQAVWNDISLALACALNLVLFPLSALCLFSLCRTLGSSDRAALLASALWTLSPAALDIHCQARPYGMIVLLTIFLVYCMARWLESGRPLDLLGCCLAAFLAGITNYALLAQAPLLALCAFAFRPGLRAAGAFLVVTAGCIAAWLAFPAGQGSMPGMAAGLGKPPDEVLYPLGSAIASFVLHTRSETFDSLRLPLAVLLIVAGSAAAGLTASAVYSFRDKRMRLAAASFAILVGAPIAFWMLGIFPAHSMGIRYISPSQPFTALIAATALSRISHRRTRNLLIGSIAAAMTASFAFASWNIARIQTADYLRDRALLGGCGHVVVDNIQRGILLPLFDVMPSNSLVYAADAGGLEQSTPELPRDVKCLCYIHVGGWGWGGERSADYIMERLVEPASRPYDAVMVSMSVFGMLYRATFQDEPQASTGR